MISRRDAIKLAVKCSEQFYTAQEIVDAAELFYEYMKRDEITAEPVGNEGDKGAYPLQEFMQGANKQAYASSEPIKVGDKVRWNHSINEWEVMAKLDSKQVAWIKSSDSSTYRTCPIGQLKRSDRK